MILLPMQMLDLAHLYAKQQSGCTKVQVGAVIVKNNRVVSLGANLAIPDLCVDRGCLRCELYSENTKAHRGPADCRAQHAEINAMLNSSTTLNGAVMYVTRYPCEACARAITVAGIDCVYYGRDQQPTDETKRIFEYSGVWCYKVDWQAEDVLV